MDSNRKFPLDYTITEKELIITMNYFDPVGNLAGSDSIMIPKNLLVPLSLECRVDSLEDRIKDLENDL